ncbi:SGNH hydrolase [Polyplosphaeria fusca]|uniref:SGNH hydrolase n=1 Tax=Polyplosphaeria fusca TaxID=682080 RepID=A0A9P4V9V0_9PLEO|nr:SGNH hydrolase [Polyplosphaeria fusca]
MFSPAFQAAFLILSLPFTSSIPLSPREDIISGTKLRILPLGDSITFGFQPSHPDGTNGYRYQLGQRLSGSDFSFVGTMRSGNMTDNYNEGHPGYTISQIQKVMAGGLDLKPNVVLLHAGTNDLNRDANADESYSGAPARLGNLIDSILNVRPDALVLVAQIINAKKAETETRIKTFNKAVPGVVKKRVVQGHKVMIVDQSVVKASELVDGLHPTDGGYAHMGDVWFENLKAAADQDLITPLVD